MITCPVCGSTRTQKLKEYSYEELLCHECYKDFELLIEYDNVAAYEREYEYDD